MFRIVCCGMLVYTALPSFFFLIRPGFVRFGGGGGTSVRLSGRGSSGSACACVLGRGDLRGVEACAASCALCACVEACEGKIGVSCFAISDYVSEYLGIVLTCCANLG
ncbi:unnamed protein product [Periconia digitata]|uniref:Uncharacterized protein n=1 Tax=Periconia digitata TaxID=1303443 RepID=A0A9W4UJP8_9PLEO|nr:unnamed protein product [Periconia digitata]